MGIFKKTASGEGALDIYYQALEHEPDPRRRQKLYYQAIEVAAGTGAWYVISDALEHLLLDGEMSRDIPKILKLAEYLKPDARQEFSSAVAELREYGLDKVPLTRGNIQDFLLDAARRGSNAAARYGLKIYGSGSEKQNPRKAEFFEASVLAALRGDPESLSFQRANVDSLQKGKFTGRENQLEFWNSLYYGLYNDGLPLPPPEEGMRRWREAVARDKAALAARHRGTLERWEQFCRQRDSAWQRIVEFESYYFRDSGLTLDELQGELEAVCDYLLLRQGMYAFQQTHRDETLPGKAELYPVLSGMAAGDARWKEPEWDPEAQTLFNKARDLEHMGRDYQQVVSLYKKAAEKGHGGAMYHLQSLEAFWPGAEAAMDFPRDACRKAGWPLAGSWRWPEVGKDDPAGTVELVRRGDMDALRHLTELMMVRWQDNRRGDENVRKSTRSDLRLLLDLELEYNRLLAGIGDCEAAFRLVWLYNICKNEPELDIYLGMKVKDSQEALLSMGRGLVCYMGPLRPGVFGLRPGQGQSLVKKALELGLTGAEKAYRQFLEEQASAQEAMERQHRQARQEAYRQARQAAQSAGMEEYRRQLDWAERSFSLFTGGDGGTRLEDHLRGKISTEQYARESFLRDQLEDRRREQLGADFDADHRFDEDDD